MFSSLKKKMSCLVFSLSQKKHPKTACGQSPLPIRILRSMAWSGETPTSGASPWRLAVAAENHLENHIWWLQPLWKMWKSVTIPYIWTKKNVPNHQPNILFDIEVIEACWNCWIHLNTASSQETCWTSPLSMKHGEQNVFKNLQLEQMANSHGNITNTWDFKF